MKKLNNFFLLILVVGCGFYPDTHDQILNAQKAIQNRQFSKAVQIYEQLLNKKLDDKIAIKISLNTGNIYSTYLNNNAKGIQYFEKVLKYNAYPQWQVKALENIAEIYFSYDKNYPKAEESYKKLINFTPKLEKYDFYKLRYSLSLLNQKKFELAEKELKQLAFETDEKTKEEVLYNLGLLNFYTRKWLHAKTYWNEFIKTSKNDEAIVFVKFLMANIFESEEKLKEAHAYYFQILSSYENYDAIKEKLENILLRRVYRKR